MSKKVNVNKLFAALDEEMLLKLSSRIDEISHPTTKGDESELNWIGLLRKYLPERYKVDSGFVIDYTGTISEQIDVIIYDRHFTPFIFRGENIVFIPAEGVYAVFEIKQNLNKQNYNYAVKKLRSVKLLKRTSAEFTHISGVNKKELFDIFGGILTKGIKSKSCFKEIDEKSDLSIVLSLDCGIKIINSKTMEVKENKPFLAFFLLKVIEKLQLVGSVPAIEVSKYLTFV